MKTSSCAVHSRLGEESSCANTLKGLCQRWWRHRRRCAFSVFSSVLFTDVGAWKSEPVWAICCQRRLPTASIKAIVRWRWIHGFNVYLASALAGKPSQSTSARQRARMQIGAKWVQLLRLQLNLHHQVRVIQIRGRTWQLNDRRHRCRLEWWSHFGLCVR